jgi:hypothetical protein
MKKLSILITNLLFICVNKHQYKLNHVNLFNSETLKNIVFMNYLVKSFYF